MTGRGGRGQCREIIPSISDPLMTGKSRWPGAHAAPCVLNAARENETAFACGRQREKKKKNLIDPKSITDVK